METLWTILMVAIGALILWRGYSALKTGEMKGKYGMTYTGAVAKSLGIMFVVVGPLVIIGSIVLLLR